MQIVCKRGLLGSGRAASALQSKHSPGPCGNRVVTARVRNRVFFLGHSSSRNAIISSSINTITIKSCSCRADAAADEELRAKMDRESTSDESVENLRLVLCEWTHFFTMRSLILHRSGQLLAFLLFLIFFFFFDFFLKVLYSSLFSAHTL